MKTKSAVLISALTFLLGASLSLIIAKGKPSDRAMFEGKSSKEAAFTLLSAAESQAEGGSWELIGIGRVYYLSGDKEKGQSLFDRVTAKKADKNDWLRIGRIYLEAGEWEKAKTIFDKVLIMDPNDDANHAEIGSYYNIKGDRAMAEELFSKAFKKNATEVWNTINIAGSYLGVKPQ